MSTSALIRDALAANPLTLPELLKAIGQPVEAKKKIADLLSNLKQRGLIRYATDKEGERIYGLGKAKLPKGGGRKEEAAHQPRHQAQCQAEETNLGGGAPVPRSRFTHSPCAHDLRAAEGHARSRRRPLGPPAGLRRAR